MIFVNRDKAAQELVQRIQDLLPGTAQHVVGYYTTSNSERDIQLEDKFRAGTIRVIVVAEAVGESLNLPDVRHVILYHLPPNMSMFKQQCKQVNKDGNCGTVHLLFGRKDVELNQLLLQDTALERLTVGQVYLALKTVNNLKGRIDLTNKQIVDQCYKQYRIFLSENGAATALKILKELNLLWWEIIDSQRVITLAPTPAQKLNIEQSLTFRLGIVAREELDRFAQTAMKLPVDELLSGI